MNKITTPANRLIIAADFLPDDGGRKEVWEKTVRLVQKLQNTGVTLKMNSVLRAIGYDAVDLVHDYGLKVMADLKLYDIADTLKIDGMLLRETKPEFLTVVCSTGVKAMKALKAELPDTEIMGVTVLTDLTEDDTQAMFACSTFGAVLRFAHLAKKASLEGLVSSAKEVPMLLEEFETLFTLNTPAIRPLWSIVPGDGQNPDRVMTPTKAIQAGVSRMVVGRPITLAKDPYDAVMRILDEIAAAL
jgi:orotidine-5'-phosphate decarboxylase